MTFCFNFYKASLSLTARLAKLPGVIGIMNSLLRIRRNLLGLIVAGLLVLTGCVTAPPAAPPTKYDPAGFAPLRIDARKLEIIENWQMPMEPPFIEHTLTPDLSSMVVDWAKYVLVPVGGSGEVVLDIAQASVQITNLPQGTALLDVFSDEQETKIRVDIVAKLMWIQPVGGKQGIVDVNSSTTRTLSESSTPNNRQTAVREVMLEAVKLLDIETRQKVRTIAEIIRP